LETPPSTIDAVRFEALVAEGVAASAEGAHERARERFAAALGLWRGAAFGDVADEGALRTEAQRLEEVRLQALEGRVAAELDAGGGADAVAELEVLVDQHPFRERLWRHLMLALYRAGRQRDALDAYRRVRKLLDEELGIEPGSELDALQAAILRHEVPEPPSLRRDRLPAPLSAFFGRSSELEDLASLLREERLVTLTGVGGVGKTRLALEAAHAAAADHADGAFFVDLSDVDSPDLVPARVASALGVGDAPGADLRTTLANHMRAREALVLLDNCEHVLVAAAEVARDVLATGPATRILCTSREPLALPGEVSYPVSPLPVPGQEARPDDLRASAAVQLFLARARAARPRVGDDDRTVESAAAICSNLDGLPLAIELAAARARALSLEDIARGLADRFRFLVSWRRLTAARHRTLRETMDWSYELLAPAERTLFAQLSIFAGGFGLGAVAALCFDGDEASTMESLERLVAASLVVPEETAGRMRYRLLETVREYAAEHLEEPGLSDRHATYFLSFAEERAREVLASGTLGSLRALDPEEANLRAAVHHLKGEKALRLTASLWRWWWLRGRVAEGREALGAALATTTDAPPHVRVEALRGASTLALRQADLNAALALATEALAYAESTTDSLLVARAQVALANAASELRDYDRAEPLYRDSARRFRGISTWELGNALLNLSDLALNRGDFAAAERAAAESLDIVRAIDDDAGIAVNIANLAFALLERGEADAAAEYFREALERSHRLGFREWSAIVFVGLAATADARGDARQAAVLLGSSARVQEEIGVTLGSFEARVQQRTREAVVAALGDAFEDAFGSGRALMPEAAVAEALAGRR
jgi:predicted ATPase